MPITTKPRAKIARVSQRDIAREAGVSRVTVSLVLAGKDQTSQDTRQRVLAAAKKLRYRPNLLVQGMRTGRTGAIGLIVPAGLHFQSVIAHGIHDEIVGEGFVPVQLLIGSHDDGKTTEVEQIHRLIDRRVDGMIIWPMDASVGDVHFAEVWTREIPLVTVDRETTTQADHVGTDEELGGRLVAEHLLALGHRRFLHVTYPARPGPMPLTHRRESFLKTIESAGGTCELIGAPFDEMSPKILAALSRSDRATAVFASTDLIAMKAYSAAAKLGLKIPDQLSIVGYADFPFAPDLVPPLTTVKQGPYEIGRTAARVLLDRVLERNLSPESRRVYLKPALIVRESTAQVPS